MTEQQDQGQKPPENQQTQESQSRQRENQQDSTDDRTVPYHRFTQLNETNKKLQSELDEIRKAQEKADEERAQKQGEYQKLADKYKTQLEREKQTRQQLEADVQRDKRMRVFTSAAQGVIRADAVEDAFFMLSTEEFSNIDEADEAAMRRLAESLADRKPFLADGAIGAGSGAGTHRPVLSTMSASGATSGENSGGKKPLFQNKQRRPSWK